MFFCFRRGMDTNQYISDVHEINLSKRSWLASDKCVSSIQQKTAWEADQTVQWRGCYFIQNASCGLFYSFHCIPSFQFVSSYHVISCRFISCRFIHAFFVSSHWISFQINSVHFMPSHFISFHFNSIQFILVHYPLIQCHTFIHSYVQSGHP